MTKEEKRLLLKELCTRLPYGVKISPKEKDTGEYDRTSGSNYMYPDVISVEAFIPDRNNTRIESGDWIVYLDNIQLYLRPMSSMTEEETEEYRNLSDEVICTYGPYNTECKFHCVRLGIKPDNPHECIDDYLNMDAIDWLNSHHFDYRGLIEKGLALEAPEDMYNF